MDFSIVDIVKYLYKWKLPILLSGILCFLLASFYVSIKQDYTAKVIIQYADDCIDSGTTPDGNTFDINEIKAPKVVLNVLDDMGYDKIPDEEKTETIDGVRGNINIIPVIPSYEEGLREGTEKLGEKYDAFYDTFIIEFYGGSSPLQTQYALSSIVKNYIRYYNEKYYTSANLVKIDYDMNNKNFDYIEQIEHIQKNINETIGNLNEYRAANPDYRSPSTGLTFDDLRKEFSTITTYDIPSVFSVLYEGQVTKDKDLLIKKYTERKEERLANVADFDYKADIAEDRMAAYIDFNVNVPNSYNMDNNKISSQNTADGDTTIIDGVDYNYEHYVKSQTTYDTLIKSYARLKAQASDEDIESQHCDNVIAKFTQPRSANIDYAAYEQDVSEKISGILSHLKRLYDTADLVISDYNTYTASLHIKTLSGVASTPNIPGMIYKALGLLLGIIFASLFFIILEIVQYYRKLENSGIDDKESYENAGILS